MPRVSLTDCELSSVVKALRMVGLMLRAFDACRANLALEHANLLGGAEEFIASGGELFQRIADKHAADEIEQLADAMEDQAEQGEDTLAPGACPDCNGAGTCQKCDGHQACEVCSSTDVCPGCDGAGWDQI